VSPQGAPSDPEGHELLFILVNNQTSIELLRADWELYDFLDGTERVHPVDCLNSPALGPKHFNLFDNFRI